MNRWFNPSHPQTLQAAVILGYLLAVFGLLGSWNYLSNVLSLGAAGSVLFFFVFIGTGIGAFGSANNQRWGYYLLAGCSALTAIAWLTALVFSFDDNLIAILRALNRMVFPSALTIAALHAHSRDYQKVWFE